MKYTEQETRFLEAMGVTPGPWWVDDRIDPDENYFVRSKHRAISESWFDDAPGMFDFNYNTRMNASLIAVAPKMAVTLVNASANLPDFVTGNNNWVLHTLETAFNRPWIEIKAAWKEAGETE